MKRFPNFDNSTAGERAIGNNRESVAVPWDPIWRGAGQYSILPLWVNTSSLVPFPKYFLSGPISQILPLWSYFSNTSSLVLFPKYFLLLSKRVWGCSQSYDLNNLRIPHRKQSHNLSSIVLVDLNYQGTDHDLLMPLGTNCVMVHNEHHTMSMIIVFLQVISSSYCSIVCNKDHIVLIVCNKDHIVR